METAEKHRLLFTQLVIMFHAACMQQLGKVENALTHQTAKDLAAAASTIDLLAMLQEKTKGNLATDEDALLQQVLRDLRLAYVQELNT